MISQGSEQHCCSPQLAPMLICGLFVATEDFEQVLPSPQWNILVQCMLHNTRVAILYNNFTFEKNQTIVNDF